MGIKFPFPSKILNDNHDNDNHDNDNHDTCWGIWLILSKCV